MKDDELREKFKIVKSLWKNNNLIDCDNLCSEILLNYNEPLIVHKVSTIRGNLYLELSRQSPKLILPNVQFDHTQPNSKSRKDCLTVAASQFNNADKALSQAGEQPNPNSALYLGKASLQLAQGNLDSALNIFDSILNIHPRNVVALMGKGRILHVKRRYTDALKIYQDVLRLSPKLRPDPRIGIGLCFWQLNCPNEAEKAWTRSSKLNPDLYAPQLLLGLLLLNEAKKPNEPDHYRVRSYNKGINLIQNAYKLNKNNSSAANALAYFFLGKRNLPAAIKLAERAVQYADALHVLVDGQINLARIYHLSDNPQSAYRWYRAALERSPNNLVAQIGRGQLLLNEESITQAVHHFDQIVQNQNQRNVTSPESLLILATLRARVLPGISSSELQKNRESARELFDKFFKLVIKGANNKSVRSLGNEPELYIEHAKLWEKDNLLKSSDSYGKALAIRQESNLNIPSNLLNNVAVLIAKLGNHQVAKNYLIESINKLNTTANEKLDKRYYECTIKYNLARVLEQSGEKIDARNLYIELTEKHPEYFECKVRLASLLIEEKEMNQAHKLLKEVLTTWNDHKNLRAFYTNFLMQYDLNSAKRFCDDTLKKVAPNDVYALCTSGWITYTKSRDMRVKPGSAEVKERDRLYREAIMCWEKALRHDPKCVFAAQGLAIAIAENVVPDAQRKDNQEKTDEDNSKARREALAVFAKIRDSLDDACVYINMGHCFYSQDEFEKAVEVYEHGLSKSDNTLSYLHACKANYSRGIQSMDFKYLEKSLDYAKIASERVPKDKSIKYNIAMIEQKMLQIILDTPCEKRNLRDLEKAIKLSPESQELFGQLAAEDPETVPFSTDLAEQRQAFGEGLTVRGPSELEKQQLYETEKNERNERSRLEKEAAKQKAKDDEAKRLEIIQQRSLELAEKRKKAHQDMLDLQQSMKAEEEAEEKNKIERKTRSKRKETDEGNLSEGQEGTEKKPKRKQKKKLKRKQQSDDEREKEDGDENNDENTVKKEDEDDRMSDEGKSNGRKRRSSDADDDDNERKKHKPSSLSKDVISDSDEE